MRRSRPSVVGGGRCGAHAGSCPSSVSPWNAPRATCCAVLGLPLAEVIIYRKSFPNILHLESPNRGYECKDRPQATPVQHCPRELSAPPRAWLRARVWRHCSEGGRGWGCRGPLRNDPGRAAQFSWLHGATSHLKATPSAAHPPTRRCVGHIPGEMSAERHRVYRHNGRTRIPETGYKREVQGRARKHEGDRHRLGGYVFYRKLLKLLN